MARSIGDLKILFGAMCGPDSGDAMSVPGGSKTGLCNAEGELKPGTAQAARMRIGILQGDALGRVTPETQMAVRQAAQHLAYAGFELEPFRLSNLERVLELWWFFFGTVVSELFQSEIRGREELLSPVFRDYLEAARPTESKPMSMLQFVAMCAARDCEREAILRAMRDVPILLSPVSTAPAFRHAEGGYLKGVRYRDAMRHSQWPNLVGLPGVSIPMASTAEGLPVGVQLIGRPHEEELLLAVAEFLELERGPWRAPSL